jgi:two-component system chemotaxis response regulator CheB
VSERIIVMGASADGIHLTARVLACLPTGFSAPILIAQHPAGHVAGELPHVLGLRSRLPVLWGEDGMLVEPGRVYVAPSGHHMLVRANEIVLRDGPEENGFRPSVDVLFRSAALAYGARVIGIVLTGFLRDGAAGLLAIKDRGGVGIVQNPNEIPVPDMPLAALAGTPIDYICRTREIAPLLIDLVGGAARAEGRGALELELENRIAGGYATEGEVRELLASSAPTPIVCPTCSSSLYRLGDHRLSRYRCASGHAFSDAGLIKRSKSSAA